MSRSPTIGKSSTWWPDLTKTDNPNDLGAQLAGGQGNVAEGRLRLDIRPSKKVNPCRLRREILSDISVLAQLLILADRA